MAKLVTRSLATDGSTVSANVFNKGAALTHSEMDSNFLNLNNNKLEITGPQTFTGDLTLAGASSSAVGSVVLNETSANGSHTVTVKAPDSITSSYNFTLPVADGTANQVLATDGSGQLVFQSIAGDIQRITITAGNGLSGTQDTLSGDHTQTLTIDTGITADLSTSQVLTNKTLTSPVLNTGVSGTAIKDEDNMTSNSATHLATQQSIKAYVDSQVATKDALGELSGDSDDVSEGSTNLYFTNARADARIAAASIGALTDVDLTGVANGKILKYNASASRFEVGDDADTEDNLANNDTDDLSEGTSNLYHTTARARAAISASGSLSYNSSTGAMTYTQGNTDTVSEGSSNLYFTNARADARISNNILDEDNFASDSATNTASQQSIKAYIATQIATKDNTDEIAEGSSNLYFTNARAEAVSINNVVEDTTPQLGGDLDTQTNALTGTDVLPSTGSYGGQATGTGGAVRLHTSGSDALVRTQQTAGKSNIVFVTDLDGSHSAGNSGSGLIYAPLNMQVRDDGHSTRTRTTFDVGVPYRGGTGATITQGSVTGQLLDVVTGSRKIYLQNVQNGSFATSTATTGKVTGTVTAVNSIGTNAVELTYDTDFASTAVESDLANLGFARFSARDVLNTNGLRAVEPELHFEAGRIAFESNGSKQIDVQADGGVDIITTSNQDVNITPNGTGKTNLKSVVVDDAGGISVKGPDYPDILTTRRNSTDPANYSIEVAHDHTSSALAAGGAAGSFGFGAYSSNGSSIGYAYPGFIAGVLGDGGSLGSGSTSVSNNAVEIKLYDNGGLHPSDYADCTQAAEFRTATTKLMNAHLVFNESSNNITVETSANGNFVLDPNGTGNIISKPTLPTGLNGPGKSYGWAASGLPGGFADTGAGTGGTTNITHINGVLSVKAGTDTPDVNMMYNEGIQITAQSLGDGTSADLSWPTLAFDASDEHGALTSPNTNRSSGDQAYGNIWFQRRNKSLTNTTQAAVESNQILGGFFGGGSTSSSTVKSTSASMFMRATEDFSGSANGTRMEFSATKNGATSTTPCLDINGDSVVINEDSNDVDFRVESNGEANALKVDAGTDTVSIETIILMLPNLPTSNPGVTGQVWNDSGTLKIS